MPEPARGLILFGMRLFSKALLFALPLALPAAGFAQDKTEDDLGDGQAIIVTPRGDGLPAPEPLQIPSLNELADELTKQNQADLKAREAEKAQTETAESEIEGEDIVPESLAPDYSKLSPKAEREAKLNDLFVKLAEREDEESANLVAEEITAMWIESGSASVNLLLRRGSEASAKGNPKLARKMYNYAVDLSPDFAEAWARSARLALTQKDYNRALNESLKTLALEPRHFYTLWTLGNTLEALNRPDDALETYREANELYPELKVVKDRLEELETEVDGTVL